MWNLKHIFVCCNENSLILHSLKITKITLPTIPTGHSWVIWSTMADEQKLSELESFELIRVMNNDLWRPITLLLLAGLQHIYLKRSDTYVCSGAWTSYFLLEAPCFSTKTSTEWLPLESSLCLSSMVLIPGTNVYGVEMVSFHTVCVAKAPLCILSTIAGLYRSPQ